MATDTASFLKKTHRYCTAVWMSFVVCSACQSTTENAQQATAEPGEQETLVFEEVDGTIAVEAESFVKQSQTDIRKWYVIRDTTTNLPMPDPDGNHVAGASGQAYLELLPDTRTTHDDSLQRGINFSPEPGKMAILDYQVHFNDTGKYYVWVRTHTSGTEDNGIHVGLDGEWPATGQRMQFDGNKGEWSWESRQRTEEVHTGVPELIYLQINTPGLHTISFSMREDGFEFDKWVMKKEYEAPEGLGPETKLYTN